MLMLAFPGFCDVAADPQPASDAGVAEMAGNQDPEQNGEPDPEETSLWAQPWFSTLGALALGVLGLLWMRRRAASL